MTGYIALLRKQPNSDFGVDFPDFPGCITAGRNLEEARRLAAEALELHIGGMFEDGDPIPAPSSLEAVLADDRNRDAIGFLVDVAPPPDRALRIDVTLPSDLVQAIDRATNDRSRFLAEAAQEKLRGQA